MGCCKDCKRLDKWTTDSGSPRETCKLDGHQVRTSIETCGKFARRKGTKEDIWLPVSNYYGQPYVCFDEKDNKYYLILKDYSGKDKIEVSRNFYNSCKREFEKQE